MTDLLPIWCNVCTSFTCTDPRRHDDAHQSGEHLGYLSVVQVADLLGMSRVAVWYKINEKKLPAEKVGRSYIIKFYDAYALYRINQSKRAAARV